MKGKVLSALIILNLVFTPVAFAAESQFRINLGVTGAPDTTPPSQPTDLTATAVSTSQINLSWTASVDNVAVSAYKVYRDGTFLATSTVTNYSDTGLSSDTLYIYRVSAVDTSGNESTQSDPASATTLRGSSGGGGGTNVFYIYDLTVVPDQKSVTITWNTYVPMLGTTSWGTTGEYKDGVIAETEYSTVHKVVLTDLLPGTQYYFEIRSQTETGITYVLRNQSFLTSGLPEGIENVSYFNATPKESAINLSWTNPQNSNFDGVRIVRNPNFYPSDYVDGKIVYQGRGESFLDSDVEKGKTYYYAIFVKDKNGNYSSGMLAQATVGASPDEPIKDVYDNLPKAPFVHPAIEALTFKDFDFIQDGKKLDVSGDSKVNIDGEKNLTISLDYNKIPEVLKSIIVTLKDPEDPKKVFSFILKVNKEKTLYSATIAPLGRSGAYAARIAIVDYKNRGLKATDGEVLVQLALSQKSTDGGSGIFWILIPLIILAIAARRIEKFFLEGKQKSLTNA